MEKSSSKKPTYPTFNEFNRKKFLNIATAVGIGVSAAAISLDLDAEEKKVTEKKADKTTEAKSQKDQIIVLVANLGHKEFKERDTATKSLITMGNQLRKNKKSVLSCFLKNELEKCDKSKDPEVKKRAKLVLAALTPKPSVRPNRPMVLGGMRAPVIRPVAPAPKK